MVYVQKCKICSDKSGATNLQRPKVELKGLSQQQQLLNFKDRAWRSRSKTEFFRNPTKINPFFVIIFLDFSI